MCRICQRTNGDVPASSGGLCYGSRGGIQGARGKSMRMVCAIDAWLDRIVPNSLHRDPEIFRQAKRVAAFDLAFLFWTVVFAGIYTALGSQWCGLVTLWAVLPILGSLLAVERGRSPAFCGNLLCLAGYVSLTALGLISGGWTAIPPMLWYTVLPVVAVLTSGVVWGFVWTLIPVASVGLFALAQGNGIPLRQELSLQSLNIFGLAVVVGLLFCQFVLAWVRVGIEQRALAALHETKQDLARAKAEAETIRAGFGISFDAWSRLHREKAALESFVKRRFGQLEINEDDADLDDADLDDSDLDDTDLADAAARRRA